MKNCRKCLNRGGWPAQSCDGEAYFHKCSCQDAPDEMKKRICEVSKFMGQYNKNGNKIYEVTRDLSHAPSPDEIVAKNLTA